MNCLYITLFFNMFVGIVQAFIKSWNQLLYPRVIEVCHQLSAPRHDFFLHLIIVVELPSENSSNLFVNFRWTFTFVLRKHMTERTSHLAGLWIGAAISNTSHSNKASSTNVKQARVIGRGSKSTAVLP